MKKLFPTKISLFAISVSILLSGCIQFDVRTSDVDCTYCSFESFNEFDLAYVDFSDTGLYLHKPQVDRLYKELDKHLNECKSLLIPVFVHGWKGSSRPNEDKVISFKSMLPEIDAGNRHVFGIYVGWRGQSWAYEPLSLPTFGSRRNAARTIGLGQFQELLIKLDTIQKNYNQNDCGSDIKLIIFGHSLGGYIVYEAVWRDIVRQVTLQRVKQPNTPIKISNIGDRIVLLNPAITAIDYSVFHSSLDDVNFAADTLPAFEIYSSTSDTAIHGIFSTFRKFQTITFDPSESRKMLNTPVSAINEFATDTITELSCDIDNSQSNSFPASVIRVSNVDDYSKHNDIWKLAELCIQSIIR